MPADLGATAPALQPAVSETGRSAAVRALKQEKDSLYVVDLQEMTWIRVPKTAYDTSLYNGYTTDAVLFKGDTLVYTWCFQPRSGDPEEVYYAFQLLTGKFSSCAFPYPNSSGRYAFVFDYAQNPDGTRLLVNMEKGETVDYESHIKPLTDRYPGQTRYVQWLSETALLLTYADGDPHDANTVFYTEIAELKDIF